MNQLHCIHYKLVHRGITTHGLYFSLIFCKNKKAKQFVVPKTLMSNTRFLFNIYYFNFSVAFFFPTIFCYQHFILLFSLPKNYRMFFCVVDLRKTFLFHFHFVFIFPVEVENSMNEQLVVVTFTIFSLFCVHMNMNMLQLNYDEKKKKKKKVVVTLLHKFRWFLSKKLPTQYNLNMFELSTIENNVRVLVATFICLCKMLQKINKELNLR